MGEVDVVIPIQQVDSMGSDYTAGDDWERGTCGCVCDFFEFHKKSVLVSEFIILWIF